MTDPRLDQLGAMQSAGAPAFVGTIALVVLSIVGFLFFDISLAAIDSRESAGHAASAYEEGSALLRAGRPTAAVEQFRTAVTIDRSNINYGLALGEALMDAGHLSDAESTLKVLLTRTENDGAVNLTMAHLMAREGRVNEAKAYFHRAIFGRWGADSTARRREARFELIGVLADRGAPAELLAELLPFEDAAVDSTSLRLRLGKLFLRAESPARAANMFRGVLRHEPENADALAGMGESALALGNFRTARADFSAAARLRPDDAALRGRLAFADTVFALDPSATLSTTERRDRARRLVLRTLAAVAGCEEANTPAADSARALTARQTPARQQDAMNAALINAAVELWAARSARCDASVHDAVLRILHAHLVS